MRKAITVFLILTLASCGDLKVVEKQGISFHFTRNIRESRQSELANGVVEEIKELKFEELGIKHVKVDSVPFSIVLYIPYENEITEDVRAKFKSLANLISKFDAYESPVNIVLTDNAFKFKTDLLYDRNAVIYTGKFMKRGRAELRISESAPTFSPEILEEVVRLRIPELYKGMDSVKIDIDMVNDTIKIDFRIDRALNNLDSLKKQFLATDRLFFDLLFARRTILFHVRDKENEQVLAVYGLKGVSQINK